MPRVSVVIPVLGDAPALASLLRHMPPDADLEMIVVDGGNDPKLDQLIAARPDVRLIRTTAGRASQMNAGATATSGDWLLFLHADSRLPDGWLETLVRCDAAVVGGWFQFGLDDTAWQARLIERGVAWRVRLFRLPYGDQGIFVRRRIFEQLGRYQEVPIMEDVDLVRRLVRAGPTFEIPLRLITSARRWRRDGWFRRSAWNLVLISLYFLGVSPSRLARWY